MPFTVKVLFWRILYSSSLYSGVPSSLFAITPSMLYLFSPFCSFEIRNNLFFQKPWRDYCSISTLPLPLSTPFWSSYPRSTRMYSKYRSFPRISSSSCHLFKTPWTLHCRINQYRWCKCNRSISPNLTITALSRSLLYSRINSSLSSLRISLLTSLPRTSLGVFSWTVTLVLRTICWHIHFGMFSRKWIDSDRNTIINW